MFLVSACLLGINCKYNAENNLEPEVLRFLEDKSYIPVCPEQLGGLSTPRIPAEIVGKKVMNKNGNDVTKNFTKGAKETLKLAKLVKAEYAIFKEKSPSCGVTKIYDGSFSNNLIKGQGVTTQLLKSKGMKIISENEIKK